MLNKACLCWRCGEISGTRINKTPSCRSSGFSSAFAAHEAALRPRRWLTDLLSNLTDDPNQNLRNSRHIKFCLPKIKRTAGLIWEKYKNVHFVEAIKVVTALKTWITVKNLMGFFFSPKNIVLKNTFRRNENIRNISHSITDRRK